MTRVAVDLLGGDAAPAAVLDGVGLVLRDRPDLEILLVGPPAAAATCVHPAVAVVAASERVEMHEEPAHAVRRKRDSTIAVATRLLRDGAADALFSAGSTGATMAAAVLALGRLPGMARPALAALLPSPRHPVVLLDVGANTSSSADQLAAFAVAGAAYARIALGLARPRVGLLTVGSEKGKGDTLRRRASERLQQALVGRAATFVGNVEGHAVPLGGAADVVVTDGFTGNVLLKGIEGTVEAMASAVTTATGGAQDGHALLARHRGEAQGGAVLLGVDGVVVVGHGASGGADIAAAISLAADVSAAGLPRRLRETLAPPAEPLESAHV